MKVLSCRNETNCLKGCKLEYANLEILREVCGITELHLNVYKNDIKALESLLSKGINVNSKNMCGLTPLHIAVITENKDVAELLLLHGANINIPDSSGYSALEVALNTENEEIIDLLLAYRTGC